MEKILEWFYTEQQKMLHGNKKPTFLDKIKFNIISYFANKY